MGTLSIITPGPLVITTFQQSFLSIFWKPDPGLGLETGAKERQMFACREPTG